MRRGNKNATKKKKKIVKKIKTRLLKSYYLFEINNRINLSDNINSKFVDYSEIFFTIQRVWRIVSVSRKRRVQKTWQGSLANIIERALLKSDTKHPGDIGKHV